ncbi:MAG TPA: recombination-associated protein RdgC [Gammaproteobacteria bacterium]
MFRSVRFYRLSSDWPDSEQQLSERLAAAAFRPCGAYTERSAGWEPPTGDPQGALCRRVAGADLLRLRTQSRLLPSAAIDDALESRLEEYRARTQEEPSRREKRRLREQTRDELLPKALVRSERTAGLVLGSEGLIAVATLSESRAERFLDHVRAAMGSLDVAPLAFDRPVGELLARIFLGDAPRGFVLGRECRMQDPSDPKATVRCADMDLADPAVRKHVKEGMELTHLGVEFGNMLSCVIDRNGGLGKLKLNGMEAAADEAGEDPLARLDAELALLSGALRELLAAIGRALGAGASHAAA